MGRLWTEGWEYGAPNQDYLQNGLGETILKQYIFSSITSGFNTGVPNNIRLANGRNIYSNYAIFTQSESSTGTPKAYIIKPLISSKNEVYFRCYFKKTYGIATPNAADMIAFNDSSDVPLLQIYNSATNYFQVKVRKSGTLTTTHTQFLNEGGWFKLDIYFKINSTTGAYEIKLDNVSIMAESSINTGSNNIYNISLGEFHGGDSTNDYTFDDIALNDTSGSVNNSWCGDGIIAGLFPKADGYATQWDNSEGYAVAESGTGTTIIKITGHGLATNDVIYNKTRDQYRIVTVTDANTLTVASVTSQAQNDIIVAFSYASTIAATAGTSTSAVVISGHTLESYDVFVNTTRSNAIRRVIYTNVATVYNSAEGQGSIVTSQVSGDSIKTFKVKFYTMAHWKACSTDKPNPQLSRIRSTTSNDIDSFDMQELTADKGIPSGVSIRCLNYHVYAKDSGTGGSEIKPILRSSATNNEGSAIPLGSQNLVHDVIYETSPFTSSAWTRAEIDGIEVGVKLV